MTQIEFGNPALDTIALFMMKISGGKSTEPYQTTANNLYSVVQGTGTTVVEGERFSWERGDVVAVPSWREHYHQAKDRVTDTPVMAKLGYLREK